MLVEVNFEVSAGIRLAVPFGQFGLGVEQVHLTRTTMLKQADDRLRATRLRDRWPARRRCFSLDSLGHQMRQREGTDPSGIAAQEGPSRERRPIGDELWHDRVPQ